MNKWIWLAVAGSIVVLSAGSFAVYGNDENRLARACTERSGTPLMSFTPKQPLLGWQFGKQTKVPANTPVLADLEEFADQNYLFWTEVFDEQEAMQKALGWTEPPVRWDAKGNGGALNKSSAAVIAAARSVDLLMGTDSRYHVSEERFEKIRVKLPTTIEQLRAVEALGADKGDYGPAVKLTVSVTCYGAFQDGQPVVTAFPTSWKIERLACADEKRCVPWEQFVGSD